MGLFSFLKTKKQKQANSPVEEEKNVSNEKSISYGNKTPAPLEGALLFERIKRLKTFNQIDLSPPSNEDVVIIIPVEGTYNTRFFTRMYLLRYHTVENVIVSGFDYIQYQIPIKATNEELILLVYGTHFFEEIQLPEILKDEIGNSKCSDVKEQLIEKCPILHALYSLKKLPFMGGNGSTNPYQIGINKIQKWIEENNRKAFDEYQLSESIDTTIWMSEYKLYNYTKFWYPDAIFQYRADWLKNQSLDIFIPSLDSGIEYQGRQHYEPVVYFGGDEKLADNIVRDRIKRELCEDNDVLLYYWPYDRRILFSTVSAFLNKTNQDVINQLSQFKPYPVFNLIEHITYAQTRNQTRTLTQPQPQPSFVYRKYTKEGVFVKEYNTIAEAAEDSGISATSVWKCLNGQYKTAGNHIWRTESSNKEPESPEIIPIGNSELPKRENTGKGKKVIQIDTQTGEVIKIYDSIASAARSVNINTKGITDVIQGKQKTAGGYYWQDYCEE